MRRLAVVLGLLIGFGCFAIGFTFFIIDVRQDLNAEGLGNVTIDNVKFCFYNFDDNTVAAFSIELFPKK